MDEQTPKSLKHGGEEETEDRFGVGPQLPLQVSAAEGAPGNSICSRDWMDEKPAIRFPQL
jgi:hypothetical protein